MIYKKKKFYEKKVYQNLPIGIQFWKIVPNDTTNCKNNYCKIQLLLNSGY